MLRDLPHSGRAAWSIPTVTVTQTSFRRKLGESTAMCTGPHTFIPAPDTARVNMKYTSNGQKVQNVLYFQKAGGWDSAGLTDLVAAVSARWDQIIKPVQNNGISLDTIEAVDAETEGGIGATTTVGVAGGNSGGALAPNNVTLVTKFSSNLTGRSHRGRVYFIGLGKDMISGNQAASGVSDGINTMWSDFFLAVETDTDSEHVIVSYCHLKAWRTTAEVTQVTNYSTENNLDSQRRRLTGRGQ